MVLSLSMVYSVFSLHTSLRQLPPRGKRRKGTGAVGSTGRFSFRVNVSPDKIRCNSASVVCGESEVGSRRSSVSLNNALFIRNVCSRIMSNTV